MSSEKPPPIDICIETRSDTEWRVSCRVGGMLFASAPVRETRDEAMADMDELLEELGVKTMTIMRDGEMVN